MPFYRPAPVPINEKDIPEFVQRELQKVGDALRDNADTIHYRTILASDASLSAGISANWKCANANVIRMSTSATVTVTGIAFKQPMREFVFINVGTGVVKFKHEASESSASHRLALPLPLYDLSANHAVTFWRDPVSARHRPIART